MSLVALLLLNLCGLWVSGTIIPDEFLPRQQPVTSALRSNASKLSVSNTLGSHMVLQQAPQNANIWGWGVPGTSVTVTLKPHGPVRTSTPIGSDKAWKVTLPPMKAGGPYTIDITDSAHNQVVLTDVLFGEVWLCGGQSNMQFSLIQAFNGTAERNASVKYGDIRLFTVGQHTYTQKPLTNLETIEQPWTPANPTSVWGKAFSKFSAICYMYGRRLHDSLGVPIGLISDNWGGTAVQLWSSSESLGECDQTRNTTYNNKCSAAHNKFPTNSTLWNAMIVPYFNMAVKGTIWYQGESNVACNSKWEYYKGLNCCMNTTNCANYYACQFPAMIKAWRKRLGIADMPFYFVQLAAYTEGLVAHPHMLGSALLRIAQTAALKLPNVEMATAIDLGDLGSPWGNIHPRDKEPVADRLWRIAINRDYGNHNIHYMNPTASSAAKSGNFVVVQFNEDTVGAGGLVAKFNMCPAKVGADQCGWAEVEHKGDGSWHNCTSIQLGGKTSAKFGIPAGVDVAAIRYNMADWPIAALYNTAGLPVVPFQLSL